MTNLNFYLQGSKMPFLGLWFWPFAGILILALIAWSLYWKGRALWVAAKNNDLKWFVAILLINTLGILEILYIYVFSKNQKN